jgi:hypothetical protein
VLLRFASRYADHLLVLLITLWAGALWTIGYIVAPSLFAMIEDRALAGSIAGRLFGIVNVLGIAAGAYVLLYCLLRSGLVGLRNVTVGLVAVLVAIALASQFGIQPMMAELRVAGVLDEAARSRFGMWHGISSALYVVQSVILLVVVLTVRRLLPEPD